MLSAAVELDFRKGHLQWTMTELARRSGVTRSLIYYYFGRSKLSIVKSAVKIMGDEIVGMSDRRLKMWRKGQYQESLRESREILEKAPYIGAFYLTCRSWSNELGETVRAMEETLLKKIQHFLPNFGEVEARAVATVYFGMVFSPFSGDVVIDQILPLLVDVFEERKDVPPAKSPSVADLSHQS